MKKTITFMLALAVIFVFSACANEDDTQAGNVNDSKDQISDERKELLLEGDSLLVTITSGSKESVDTVYNSFVDHTMSDELLCDLAIQTSDLHTDYQESLDSIDAEKYTELADYKNFVTSYVQLNKAISLNIGLYLQGGDATYINDLVEYVDMRQESYDVVIQCRQKLLSTLGFSDEEIAKMITDSEATVQ